jgi:hypothetical protein
MDPRWYAVHSSTTRCAPRKRRCPRNRYRPGTGVGPIPRHQRKGGSPRHGPPWSAIRARSRSVPVFTAGAACILFAVVATFAAWRRDRSDRPAGAPTTQDRLHATDLTGARGTLDHRGLVLRTSCPGREVLSQHGVTGLNGGSGQIPTVHRAFGGHCDHALPS